MRVRALMNGVSALVKRLPSCEHPETAWTSANQEEVLTRNRDPLISGFVVLEL